MPDQPTTVSARTSRHWWLAAGVIAAVVLFRAAVFVFWERAHFDADQAITGLMGKHLAEGRALPLFWYGQSYMLAVESWMAAPLFIVLGVSVTALKLPLLAINVAIAVLLWALFVREARLSPLMALIPALFFALPAAGTAARLVEANGGNVEPFLYVLLIWVVRRRPVLCGLVLGLGFLHREFTLYGFLALLGVEAISGELFTVGGALRRTGTLATAAGLWLVVQWTRRFSSAAGPGTSLADVYGPQDNISALASRVCVDPHTLITGFHKLAAEHWTTLYGTLPLRLRDFGVVSAVNQGAPWMAWLLLAIVLIALAGIVSHRRGAPSEFCTFLVATGLLSACGYVVARCGAIDFYFMRYELLSMLGIAGLAARFLQVTHAPLLRGTWLALVAGWFIVTAVPHLQLYAEYLRHPPEDVRRTLIAELDKRQVRYAASSYWIAYAITFLTDERIIVKSEDLVRIREYQRIVDDHAAEAWRVERQPCGEEIMPRIYLCK
jgi:hypothetical protein